MNRLFKWLLPALIVAEIALVRFGVIDFSTALWAIALLEVVLIAVAGRQLVVAYRGYRRGRSEGMNAFSAIEEGLSVLLPRPVAKVATLEPRMYWAFGKWVGGLFARRAAKPCEFTYHRKAPIGVFVWVVILLSPIELGLLELLIPSHLGWLKILLLVGGVYTLFWFLAFFASMTTHPHFVGADALELNYGLFFNARLCYSDIASVEQRIESPPGRGGGLKIDKERRRAYLSVGTPTNLYITLVELRSFATLFKTTPAVEGIGFFADEPAALFTAVKALVAPQLGSMEARNLDQGVVIRTAKPLQAFDRTG